MRALPCFAAILVLGVGCAIAGCAQSEGAPSQTPDGRRSRSNTKLNDVQPEPTSNYSPSPTVERTHSRGIGKQSTK